MLRNGSPLEAWGTIYYKVSVSFDTKLSNIIIMQDTECNDAHCDIKKHFLQHWKAQQVRKYSKVKYIYKLTYFRMWTLLEISFL